MCTFALEPAQNKWLQLRVLLHRKQNGRRGQSAAQVIECRLAQLHRAAGEVQYIIHKLRTESTAQMLLASLCQR